MLFERIESKGIAHYSYMVGDGTKAVVIDPRRDIGAYLKLSQSNGMKIEYILETHRHEDFLVGSPELGERTSAQVFHADCQLEYGYGTCAKEGQKLRVGRLEIEALDTPGHTPGSMSYLLRDTEGNDWAVFTGDALFAGDVGRVDFMGKDRLEHMAGLLYDSIFDKILCLEDGTLVCPAHGSGSVCGDTIAERTWTTIGLERSHNPKLAYGGRDEFVRSVARELEYPPYFREMERRNLTAGEGVMNASAIPALGAGAFKKEMGGAVVLDTRMEYGFGSAHIPGALSIWTDGIPSFGGWFLPYDKRILLVSEMGDAIKAATYLARMGYDNVEGYLSPDFHSWLTAGNDVASIRTTTVQDLCHKMDNDYGASVLDVRSNAEIEREGRIPGSINIQLTQLPENAYKVPKDRKVHIFCGSGLRSMTAASILKGMGWNDIEVMLGGVKGWSSISCPLE